MLWKMHLRLRLCYNLIWTMLKNVIAPIQAWLLSQGRCVGCGKELPKGKKVTCGCGRIFIYNPETKKYRRALLEEV